MSSCHLGFEASRSLIFRFGIESPRVEAIACRDFTDTGSAHYYHGGFAFVFRHTSLDGKPYERLYDSRLEAFTTVGTRRRVSILFLISFLINVSSNTASNPKPAISLSSWHDALRHEPYGVILATRVRIIPCFWSSSKALVLKIPTPFLAQHFALHLLYSMINE